MNPSSQAGRDLVRGMDRRREIRAQVKSSQAVGTPNPVDLAELRKVYKQRVREKQIAEVPTAPKLHTAVEMIVRRVIVSASLYVSPSILGEMRTGATLRFHLGRGIGCRRQPVDLVSSPSNLWALPP
jgi:hypothetical protein